MNKRKPIPILDLIPLFSKNDNVLVTLKISDPAKYPSYSMDTSGVIHLSEDDLEKFFAVSISHSVVNGDDIIYVVASDVIEISQIDISAIRKYLNNTEEDEYYGS